MHGTIVYLQDKPIHIVQRLYLYGDDLLFRMLKLSPKNPNGYLQIIQKFFYHIL